MFEKKFLFNSVLNFGSSKIFIPFLRVESSFPLLGCLESNFEPNQKEKSARLNSEEELQNLRKEQKIQLAQAQKESRDELDKLNETIEELKALKPEELQKELDIAKAEVQKIQLESQVLYFTENKKKLVIYLRK